MASLDTRQCTSCGSRLSSYNTSSVCAACDRAGRAIVIPPSTWTRPEMREALAEHDFGRVSRLLQQWSPLTQRQIAEMIGMDQPGLSRIENDRQRVRHVSRFFRFVEGLRIPLDLVLPEGLRQDLSEDESVRRRTMLAGAAGIALDLVAPFADEANNASDLPDQVRRTGHAARLRREDVEALRATADGLYSLDARLGGDQLWRFAIAQLHTVKLFIDNFEYSDAIGRELQRISGELRASIGWYSFDAGRYPQAHQYMSEALNLAYMTDDHLLISRTLANMARQAVHLGRPREAVLLAQRGIETTGRFVTPRLRALLNIREAQGWAALGRDSQCDDAVSRAWREFERGTKDRDPEWVSFLNDAELACLEGMCRADLGQHRRADTLLRRSISLHTEGFRRNMSIGLIRLAMNSLHEGDPVEAATNAIESASVAAELTSSRVRGELKALGSSLAAHDRIPVVRDAIEAIATA